MGNVLLAHKPLTTHFSASVHIKPLILLGPHLENTRFLLHNRQRGDYALADGVAAILARATRGPLCAPRPPDGGLQQLELFEL